MVAVDHFVDGLQQQRETGFDQDLVLAYIKGLTIDPASLGPYMHFSTRAYTRNMIYRDSLFEVLAICWAPGQRSAIHDHANQKCWMAVPIGSLLATNYRIVSTSAAPNEFTLAPGTRYWMNGESPGMVTLDEPVHYITNPLEVDQLAVSIHIYSKPIERCTAFDLEHERMWEVSASYYSQYGRVCRTAEPQLNPNPRPNRRRRDSSR